MRTKLFVLFAVAAMLCAQASAGTSYWTGASDSDWSNGGNWDTGVPAAGDDVVFNTTTASFYAFLGPNDGAAPSRTVGTITLSNDQDFTISTAKANCWDYAWLNVNSNIIVDGAPSPHTYNLTTYVGMNAAGPHMVYVGTGHTLNLNSPTGYMALQASGGGYNHDSYSNWTSGGNDVTFAGGGVVHVNGGIYAKNIDFQIPTSLSGDVAFRGDITGWSNIYNFGPGWFIPFANSTADTVWDRTIDGQISFAKSGASTMAVQGTNGYINSTGFWMSGLYIDKGNLVLDKRPVNNPNQIGDSTSLQVGKPATSMFQVIGSDTEDSTETIGWLTPNQGTGIVSIDVQHSAGHSTVVTFAGVNATNAVLIWSGNDLGGSDPGVGYSRIMLTNPGGLYGFASGDFAGYDPVLGVTGMSEAGRVGQINDFNDGTKNLVVNDPQNPLTADRLLKSLKINTSGDIDLTGMELRLQGGAVLKNGGPSRLTNGRIYAPGGTLIVMNEGDIDLDATLCFPGTPGPGTWGAYGNITKAGGGKLKISGTYLLQYPLSLSTTIQTFGTRVAVTWAGGDLEFAAPNGAVFTYYENGAGAEWTVPITYNLDTVTPLAKKLTISSGRVMSGMNTDNPITMAQAETEITGGEYVLQGQAWWPAPISFSGTVTLTGGKLKLNRDLANTRLVMNGGTLEGADSSIAPGYLSSDVTMTFVAGKTTTIDTGPKGNVAQTAISVYAIDGSGNMKVTGRGTPGYPSDWYAGLQLTDTTGASAGFTGNIIVTGTGQLNARNASYLPANMGKLILEPGAHVVVAGRDTQTWTGRTIEGDGLLDTSGIMRSGYSDGTLAFSGGTIRPKGLDASAGGTLTVNGRVTFDPLNLTTLAIGADSATSHGRFVAQNNPVGGGVGSISFLDGVNLSVTLAAKKNWLGQVLTIVSAPNDLTLQGALGGLTFNNTGFADVTVSTNDITLSNISYPGDANRDGITDMSDYIIWFNNFGQTSAPGCTSDNWLKADFNGDGITDMTDYIAWFNYFGDDQSSFAVPEPATLALLALGLPLLRRKRR